MNSLRGTLVVLASLVAVWAGQPVGLELGPALAPAQAPTKAALDEKAAAGQGG